MKDQTRGSIRARAVREYKHLMKQKDLTDKDAERIVHLNEKYNIRQGKLVS